MAEQPSHALTPWPSRMLQDLSSSPKSDNGKQDQSADPLEVYARAFAPQHAKRALDAFALSSHGHSRAAGGSVDDHPDEAELSKLLNAQLLNDMDAAFSTADKGSTRRDDTPSSSWSHLKENTSNSPWYASPTANEPQADVKHIWDTPSTATEPRAVTERDAGRWDRFEPYSDEAEFDPTLQFYHGSLLDSDTIRDIGLLSAMDPSLEEKQADNLGEDMSPLQMLESVFTDISEPELADALARHDYDVDRTMESLMNKKMNDVIDPVPPQAGNEDATPKRRQVCRHFLAGECYRKDCWFAHDLEIKVCKFWLQGSCLKGDLCEFSHFIDVQEVASKINAPAKKEEKKPVKFDELEYPELGRPSHYRPPPLPRGASQQETNQADTGLRQEEFPSLSMASTITRSPAGARSVPQSVKKPFNFAEAAKTKNKVTGKSAARYPTLRSSIPMHHLKRPVSIPWLETGSTLNTNYLEQRKQAIEYGMLRNRLFTRSSECYHRGDGAKARAFSQEAKYYNRLMQEMHTEASRRIFEQRNQSEAFVDLHGLHVDEALEMLEERLERLHGYEGIVYVVTGTGHHSGASGLSKKQSKLKPNVESYLREMHYRFAETSVVGDARGGVFAVDLSAR